MCPSVMCGHTLFQADTGTEQFADTGPGHICADHRHHHCAAAGGHCCAKHRPDQRPDCRANHHADRGERDPSTNHRAADRYWQRQRPAHGIPRQPTSWRV